MAKRAAARKRQPLKKNNEPLKMPKWLKIVLIAAAALALIGMIVAVVISESKTVGRAELPEEATSAEDLPISHIATINVKDYGTIKVGLSQAAAPATVINFVNLAEKGFYDGLTFHRIVRGFMMQGGDPMGDGTGGTSNKITGEFLNNGIRNPIRHVRGAISMARSGNSYNSASCQFFIVQTDADYLDGDYAGFGFVTEGMDVVDEICRAAEPIDDNGLIAKEEQPVIESITIEKVKN